MKEPIITISKPENPIIYTYKCSYANEIPVVKLEDGLKIECREDILEYLQSHPYVQDNFNLNIKRLNRWWYSIYFEKKDG